MIAPVKPNRLAVLLAAILAAQAALTTTSRAQVTWQNATNGLIAYYPLDGINPDGVTTPDLVGGRDMNLFGMNSANVVAGGHPTVNPAGVSNCFNFTQTGAGTVIYYASTGMSPLTGAGDYFPFNGNRNATMNFWIKGNGQTGGSDKRFFGEADNTGQAGDPLWLIGNGSLTADTSAHFLLRHSATSDAPGNSTALQDGTYQLPAPGYYWSQGSEFTRQPLLDGTWHMFTMTIDSNASVEVYIDAVKDLGNPTTLHTNFYGQPACLSPMFVTNTYYTTNIYPAAGVSNPPPRGYVGWVMNGMFNHASTTFGGFKRGTVTAGLVCQIDDIAFWNRVLDTNELTFVMTNGLNFVQPRILIRINKFAADFPEAGVGDTIGLSWNVSGVTTNPGSLVLSGVGDVSALGNVGSTNVLLGAGSSYTFTLTAHNGSDADKTNSVTVTTSVGVDVADWHLISRFDNFPDTFFGIGIDAGTRDQGWISAQSSYIGPFDRFNVVSITNNGGANKALSPKSGYVSDANSPVGYDSRGALAWVSLYSLTMAAGQSNTLFFRFSLHDPYSFVNAFGKYSGMDFVAGISDFRFWAGPLFPGGLGAGPDIHIVRSSASYADVPFDLQANDYSGTAITNTYSYVGSVDANGLQTNVNYFMWLDVIDNNIQPHDNGDGTSNTIGEAVFSAYLMKQGDTNRTLLFSGYHGDRDAVIPDIFIPTPALDKVFFSIGTEDVTASTAGAYFETNRLGLIAIDDVYFSKGGFKSTIPRLFDIRSVVQNAGSVTLTWDSLGSLYQTNTYSVQRKLSLTDASWTTLTNGLPSGGDTTTYVDNTIGSGSSAYYRIVWP